MLNLSIHGSVGLFGEEAFSSCSNLKCISFYDNVKFIRKSAFYQCFSLIYVSYLGTKSPSYSDLVFADSLVGSVNVVNNYEDTNFCSYPISFLPFSHFTPSDTFSKSDGITPTNAFSKSCLFSESSEFTKSKTFPENDKNIPSEFTLSKTFSEKVR